MTLSRYTTIPAMLDALLHQHLVLVNPAYWTDRNDREVMEAFTASRPTSRVFAACLAEGNETAHHWQVFADTGKGACIRFDRQRLIAAVEAAGALHGPISYVNWRDLSGAQHLGDRLAFLKRSVFRFEREYRIIAVSEDCSAPVLNVPVPLSAITSIYISGEIPPSLFSSISSIVRSIPGCRQLRVRHSGLLRNENWSRSFENLLSSHARPALP